MYHTPKMCRTCLQMSRGDFKFVSLDSVDPLWESNSPNLKQQLISLIPEMKIDSSGSYICTSCFIALRTAYEFKRMCQVTEQKFQNHNYKYRRPFGIGPGSAQFHVALNDNSKDTQSGSFRCQNLKYLQADTSIDITEHHLYDASKVLPPKQLSYITNVTQKLPEIDVEVIIPPEKTVEKKTANDAMQKKLNSLELRKKYNIGSEISILKNDKTQRSMQALVKTSCKEIPFLNQNGINPEKLNCFIEIQMLTDDFIKSNTCGKYLFNELKDVANSYYFDNLDEMLTCQFCSKMFSTRFSLQLHEDEHAVDKFFVCSLCDLQFVIKNSLEQHLAEVHNVANTDQPVEEKKDIEPEPRETLNEATGILEIDGVELNKVDTVIEQESRKMESNCSDKTNIIILPSELNVAESVAENYNGQTKEVDPLEIDETKEESVKTLIENRKKRLLMRKKYKIIRRLKKKYKTIKNQCLKLKNYYCRCFVCNKICSSKLQLSHHYKFTHIPNVSSRYWPNIIAKAKVKVIVKEEEEEEVEEVVETSTRIMRVRKPDPKALHRCNICDKAFLEERFLPLHMYVHIPTILSMENSYTGDEGPENFICYLCDKTFVKERFLKLHNLQVHLIKTTVCKICHREFKSEFWFNRHRCLTTEEEYETEEEHEDEEGGEEKKSFPCNFCNRTFARVRFMKSHRRRMHTDLIKFKSKINSELIHKGFNDPPMKLYLPLPEKIMIKNEKTENEEDPENLMMIEGINDEAVNLDSNPMGFRRRSVNRTTPRIQCDFCGEFIEENRYDNHIFEHNKIRLQKSNRKSDADSNNISLENSLEKPKVLLKCHICFKGFSRKYNLMNHINRHESGELPMVIPEIVTNDSVRSDEDELYASDNEEEIKIEPAKIFVTSDSKVYECCGRVFKWKHHFARHYKNKHSESVPSPPTSKIGKIKTMSGEESEFKQEQDYKVEDGPVCKEEENVEFCDVVNSETEDKKIGVKRKSENVGEFKEEIVKKKRKRTEADMLLIRKSSPVPEDDESDESKLLKYECHVCEKKFKQKCQVRDHLNVHTGAKPYPCIYCTPNRGFTQSSSLYVHYRRVHAVIVQNCVWEVYSKNGACLTCQEIFEKHSAMFWHMKEHYIESPFKCHICKDKFSMICHYKIHDIDPEKMRNMVNEDSKKAKIKNKIKLAPNADLTSSLNDDLNDTTISPIISCVDCDKSFTNKRDLRFHKKSLAHFQQLQLLKKQLTDGGENNAATGDDLDTIEDIQNSVNVIMQKISTIKNKKHHCLMCGMSFVRKIQLRKHKRKMHRAIRTKPKINKKPTSILLLTPEPSSEIIDKNEESLEMQDDGILINDNLESSECQNTFSENVENENLSQSSMIDNIETIACVEFETVAENTANKNQTESAFIEYEMISENSKEATPDEVLDENPIRVDEAYLTLSKEKVDLEVDLLTKFEENPSINRECTDSETENEDNLSDKSESDYQNSPDETASKTETPMECSDPQMDHFEPTLTEDKDTFLNALMPDENVTETETSTDCFVAEVDELLEGSNELESTSSDHPEMNPEEKVNTFFNSLISSKDAGEPSTVFNVNAHSDSTSSDHPEMNPEEKVNTFFNSLISSKGAGEPSTVFNVNAHSDSTSSDHPEINPEEKVNTFFNSLISSKGAGEPSTVFNVNAHSESLADEFIELSNILESTAPEKTEQFSTTSTGINLGSSVLCGAINQSENFQEFEDISDLVASEKDTFLSDKLVNQSFDQHAGGSLVNCNLKSSSEETDCINKELFENYQAATSMEGMSYPKDLYNQNALLDEFTCPSSEEGLIKTKAATNVNSLLGMNFRFDANNKEDLLSLESITNATSAVFDSSCSNEHSFQYSNNLCDVNNDSDADLKQVLGKEHFINDK